MGLVRLSSARRRPDGRSPLGMRLVIAAAAALVVTVAVLELARRRADESPEGSPTPSPSPTAIATRAEPTITPTPTPAARASTWTALEPPPPSPTETPVRFVPRIEQRPTSTPVTGCVEVRWTASQTLVGSAQVVIQIDAINRCPRDLETTEVSFTISGLRDGAMVQTVRGLPFRPLRRGFSEPVTIGLPGSLDWYDTITVVTTTPYGSSTSVGRTR